MDTFMNAFMLLAFYFAVRVAKLTATGFHFVDEKPDSETVTDPDGSTNSTNKPSKGLAGGIRRVVENPLFFPSLGFGIALGLAASSKLDAAPMALALPAAMFLLATKIPSAHRNRYGIQAIGYLFLAALVSVLLFRIFSPMPSAVRFSGSFRIPSGSTIFAS
jgi:hypothetical protein